MPSFPPPSNSPGQLVFEQEEELDRGGINPSIDARTPHLNTHTS